MKGEVAAMRLVGHVRSPRSFCVVVLSALFVAPAHALRAEDRPADAGDAARKASVDKGLKWLAGELRRDGWERRWREPVASASLAGLAFLESGAKPGADGAYGPELRTCLAYVKGRADPGVGLITSPGDKRPFRSHALATHFLAEAFAITKDESLFDPLAKAVRFVEWTRGDEGAWGAAPNTQRTSRWTAENLDALFAADAAGVKVDGRSIAAGLAYLRSCQRDDGGIALTAAGATNTTIYDGWTAVALVPLYHGWRGGQTREDRFTPSLNHLSKSHPSFHTPPDNTRPNEKFMAAAYGARGAYLAGGAFRREHYPQICRFIARLQRDDGSWANPADMDPPADTALALIALQLPEERLYLLRPR
jgi:hypothetical protein